MQVFLSSSADSGDGPTARGGFFAEGRASCIFNLDASFVARSSVVVAGFVRVVLRMELADLVGGIEV